MYGFLWRIGIFEVVGLAANCFVALSAGIIFSVFPDEVQRFQLGLREPQADNTGRKSLLGRLSGLETRLISSERYIGLLKTMGYACLLVSGILTSFLVTYILRV